MEKICPHCGSVFSTPRRSTIYCNKDCYGASRRGIAKPDLTQRLDDQIEMIPISGCWIWMGYTTPDGHGKRRRNGRNYGAHKLAYCDHHQITPEYLGELVVRHRCDVPSCVNPNHLEAGTHADNKQDSINRGRHAYGERSGGAKLTAEEVASIRAAYVRGSNTSGSLALGRKYGVSDVHVRMIVTNKTRVRG